MRAHFADKHTDVDRCGIMSSTCLAKQPRISISRPQTLRVEHTVRIGLSPLSPDILAMVDQGLRELGATPTLRDDSGRHDVLWSIAAAAQQAVADCGAWLRP
jgi:hypothetical protein